MISKERLKELIEKGATIVRNSMDWDSGKSMGVDEIKLNNNYKITANNCNNGCFLMYNGIHTSNLVEDLKNLYENIDDYNWHKDFGCITRTERLELPTWEEFSKWDKSIKFYNNSTKYSMYVFVKNKNTKNCRIIIYADNGEQDWFVFEQPLTQENYLKACRKCKELFLGGSDGDIR